MRDGTGTRGRAGIALALALLVLAACGGQSDQVPLESLEPEDIFRRAEVQLETGSRREQERAAALFGEVERLYPYSEWAKRALIMQAFAYHKNRDYEAARQAAQRFIDFYPGDEDAAYARYLLALSYYDQIDAVGRDQGLTFQALQALREVIELHPETEYARSSVLKFDLAFDHLAAKEMEIGRYYLKRGHFAASVNRFRSVVEDFQTTTQTPEALYRLVEAYVALGLRDEAQTAGAILGYNFQSTVWYQDAFTLLTGEGLALEPAGEGWLRSIYRQMIRGEWL